IPIQYQDTRLPWTVPGSWSTRKALSTVMDDIDGIFIHTITLAMASIDLFDRKPTILSGDATPYAKRKMRAAYGLKPERGMMRFAKREIFREVFRRAAGLVAWSNWAKQ